MSDSSLFLKKMVERDRRVLCLKKFDLLPLIKIPPTKPPIPPSLPPAITGHLFGHLLYTPTHLNGDLVIHSSVFKEFMTVFVCGPLLCVFKL